MMKGISPNTISNRLRSLFYFIPFATSSPGNTSFTFYFWKHFIPKLKLKPKFAKMILVINISIIALFASILIADSTSAALMTVWHIIWCKSFHYIIARQICRFRMSIFQNVTVIDVVLFERNKLIRF